MNETFNPSNRLSRSTYLQIVRAALDAAETLFARETILNWLAAYPGDLQANLQYAETLVAEGKPSRGLPILSNIVDSDPEYLPAYQTLLNALRLSNPNGSNSSANLYAQTMVYALSGKMTGDLPTWVKPLRMARIYLNKNQPEKGMETLQPILDQQYPTPLIPITYLELDQKPAESALEGHIQLLENCHNQWPSCLFFTLRLADGLISWGEHARAIAMLNQAVARDVSGQVATRIWGENHRYRTLWPDTLELPLPGLIPYKVITRLGWNILPEGESTLEEEMPVGEENSAEEQENREDENLLLKVALAESLPTSEPVPSETPDQADHHKPEESQDINERIANYVIVSIQQSLEDKFGLAGCQSVIAKMNQLSNRVGSLPGWKSLTLLADQPASDNSFHLTPAKPGDPWSLKLFLNDLERKLAEKNERIGAVLIVGGPDIVPFHHLPNPITDPDPVVLSDNPYATSDENYFIPEWPVGRVPDGCPKNPDQRPEPKFLLGSLDQIIETHREQPGRSIWYRNWFPFGRKPARNGNWPSLGYSAAVWASISEVVFSPIGKSNDLLASPPYGKANDVQVSKSIRFRRRMRFWDKSIYRMKDFPKMKGRLAYFNLHGIEDGPEWFGQRDLTDNSPAPDYPVALKPENIPLVNHSNKDNLPQIIFSEACYGANILNKSPEEAICLKFLAAGCKALIGSTSMSYGSVNTPMIAADLLSHSFWLILKEGLTAGEAYMRAKIHLVQTMHARQGHLDGEDQKTMLSFVFYGDPLAYPDQHRVPQAPWRPPVSLKKVKTIHEGDTSETLPPQVISHVKKIVSRYLPGMADAKYLYSQEEIIRNRIENSGTQPDRMNKQTKSGQESHQHITLSKQIHQNNHIHNQVAHLTLTSKGKLIKLTVSR